MSKFKVGDIVKCIEPAMCDDNLTEGSINCVSHIDDCHVYFSNSGGWHERRFELIKSATDAPQPQPDSLVAAFTAVHDAIAPLSSLDRRKVIHAVKVLLDIQ